MNDEAFRRYCELRSSQPGNVSIVMPEERISVYTLMDAAAVGLTYGSTAGLEMACQGKPMLHAGIGAYRNAGFMEEYSGEATYGDQLDQLFNAGFNAERQELAFRFFHWMYMTLCLPFSKVGMGKSYFEAKPTYSSVAELAPGLDPDLDRAVDVLLGESRG